METTKISINMPTKLYEELRARAERRGITVTELMRRAVAIEGLLFGDDNEAEVVIKRDGAEKVLHFV